MINAIDKVRNRLRTGESCIYHRNDSFSFYDISIVGTHSFYITDLGRILAHDTGGIFGSEQLHEYDATKLKIKVTMSESGVKLENAGYDTISFSFNIQFSEFMNIYSLAPKEIFLIQSAKDKIPCYIKYGEQNYFRYSNLQIDQNKVLVENCSIKEIPYRRIKDYTLDRNMNLNLVGIFDDTDQAIDNITIFIPFMDELRKILLYVKKSPGLYRLLDDSFKLFPSSFTGKVNSYSFKDKQLTLAVKENSIKLLDEISLKYVIEFDMNTNEFYFDSVNNILLVIKNNVPFYFKLQRKDSIIFAKDKVFNKGNVLYSKPGLMSGMLLGKSFSKEQIDVAFSNGTIKFINSNMLSVKVQTECSKIKFFIDSNMVFLLSDDEISLITLSDDRGFDKFIQMKLAALDKINEQKIGLTADNNPFLINHNEYALNLYQSPENVIKSFLNTDVADITVAKIDSSSSLIEIKITFNSMNSKLKDSINVFIHKEYLNTLIHNVYYFAKKPLMENTSCEQLYMSWSRQVNDYILYNCFGQLFTLYEGIEEISSETKDINVRNRNIANFLFYGINAQKRRLDAASIYIPAMLEKEDRHLLSKESSSFDERPFKQLQKNLLGITAQTSRYLNEIESALSAISSCIIPRADMDRMINQRKEDGLKTAALTALGGIFMPALFVSTIFMGVNTYNASKSMKLQQELNQENEDNRVNFYVMKALDAFDHLMQVIMPYYISEISTINYGFFRQLAPSYTPVLENKNTKETLFNRITQYYTFKQLPIDGSVPKSKKELVSKIHNTVSIGNQQVNMLKQEVDVNIPRSISSGV